MAKLTVTPAAGWKRKTEAVQLPSGNVAELKRPNAISLIMEDDNIPDQLTNFVLGRINGTPDGTIGVENRKPVMMLARLVAQEAFVNPRIVEGEPDYDNGEISISDVDDFDLFAVLEWAVSAGGNFRPGAAAAAKQS